MGTIVFEGAPPYELATQRPPTARAESENVVVTLPVFLPTAPAQTLEVQANLTLEHAEHLEAVVRAALIMARVNRKQGR